jgi:hypothetical protein
MKITFRAYAQIPFQFLFVKNFPAIVAFDPKAVRQLFFLHRFQTFIGALEPFHACYSI